ncbi:xanthine dehydrogenase molybdopterin binding subunit [Usitatibacter palustris]|uniref:Aldehyde oxidoreductase n=1 Tax=Usitatibacter palustris TaxID=2732487 RepID=A0A6M4H960_9PROT|nr:xanthine dehydrogenase molybdopterin binding subunit [Usitatibacter palustris]QJR15273.1 Aldehyde oxidoreductase [Usitatibacter palustris]
MSVGERLPHESAHLHVSGAAPYADDIPLPPNTLHGAFGLSTVAHGRIASMDLAAAAASAGVHAVLTANDIPGANNCAPVIHDDPILADGLVQYAGQTMFLVLADSHEAARKAARKGEVRYEKLPAIFDIREALAAGSFVAPTRTLIRGEPIEHLASAPQRLQGTMTLGGQDHFYLEGQVAFALPQEDGGMLVVSSTQHPSEVQHLVAHALGLKSHDVTVQCRRMGGGFGGKETQAALIACAAAVAAWRTKRPVKLRLDRDDDMVVTGKRHEFLADYDVGFDADGRIIALDVMMASRCGYSLDLSTAVNDRAVCHVDNAYYLEHVRIVSHRCKTNTVSNTAFRGFGGPQGMMVIESVIDEVARTLGRDPLDVRRVNFYGDGERNTTPYGMTIEDNVMPRIATELEASSAYRERREAVARHNRANTVTKRGLAFTPVKFGISFNATLFNQAGALVHVYTDGSVLVNHGGTEMGQGLYTKVLQVVAEAFGLPRDRVRPSTTDTSKVPNTSATAASAASDLNGKAAQAAALAIRTRMAEVAAKELGVEVGAIRFADGAVHGGTRSLDFAAVARRCHEQRVSLSSSGFYRTPKIHWDRDKFTGRPFFYFAYGAAVSEVEVDTRTGENRLVRVDILHDVGRSLNPAIDLGQIEGGFLQGMGWLTTEELCWNAEGHITTHAPSTYKIPTAREWPAEANVRLLDNSNVEDSIHRSKAVGEPPLMLGMSVFFALRDAVAACGSGRESPRLRAPATPEALLDALDSLGAA